MAADDVDLDYDDDDDEREQLVSDIAFFDLASRAGFVMGSNEIEARQFLGDDEYDRVHTEMMIDGHLNHRKLGAEIDKIKSTAAVRSAIALLLYCAPLLATAWSLWFWIH